MAVIQGAQAQQNTSGAEYVQQVDQNQFAAPMSFGMASRLSVAGEGEYFNKLFTGMATILKPMNESAPAENKIHLIKMSKQDSGLHYSTIIVAMVADGQAVAHCLVVEKTGDPLVGSTEFYGNNRIDFTPTPGDTINQKYVSVARKFVSQALGVSFEKTSIADSTLVPNEFTLEREDDILRVLSNAVNAVDVEIQTRLGNYAGINIVQFINQHKAGRFVIEVTYNTAEDVLNTVGMPVRQDFCLSLKFQKPEPRQMRDVHRDPGAVEIVRVYGYIDFMVVNRTNHLMVPGMPGRPKTFQPEVVITDMVTPSAAPTTDLLILGVIACAALNEDFKWLQTYKTTAVPKGQIDYKDIGALNVVGNHECSPTTYGVPAPTKSQEMTTQKLFTLVNDLCESNVMISIDIPRAAPNSWNLSVFGFAAGVGLDAQHAAGRIHNALTTLTNGVYNQMTNGVASSPFANLVNRIHGGYYRAPNNTIKDIRHLSNILALTNHYVATNQPPELLESYIASLSGNNANEDVRATTRKPLIDQMSGGTAVYKEMYARHTFDSGFLETAISALAKVGFLPTSENSMGGNDVFQRRAFTNVNNMALGAGVRVTSSGSTNGFGGYTMPYTRGF